MVEARIGARYANSLFGLAQEKKMLNDVKDDMNLILQACQESRQLVNLLESPIIPSSRKNAILQKVFDGKFISPLTMLIVDLLSRKGRDAYLPSMAREFLKIYDQEFDISRGILTSVYKLPEKLVSQIRDKLEEQLGTTLILEQKLDESMIGGFKIQIGDQLYDGSVTSALRKMRNKFELN